MRTLFLSIALLLVSCGNPPPPACDCNAKPAPVPTSCPSVVAQSTSAPAEPKEPKALLEEKRALLNTLLKEIDALEAQLAPPPADGKAEKTAEKPSKKAAASPKKTETEKPTEEPKKAPKLTVMPR